MFVCCSILGRLILGCVSVHGVTVGVNPSILRYCIFIFRDNAGCDRLRSWIGSYIGCRYCIRICKSCDSSGCLLRFTHSAKSMFVSRFVVQVRFVCMENQNLQSIHLDFRIPRKDQKIQTFSNPKHLFIKTERTQKTMY